MGDARLWQVKRERERIYSLPEMSEVEGMKVADLETEFAVTPLRVEPEKH